MAIELGRLRDVTGAADPITVLQYNLEVLSEMLDLVTPSYQYSEATDLIGPPTTGAWLIDTLWKDSLGAQFRCTAAGTPGTWRQEKPAVVETPPASGTVPTGYLIIDKADSFLAKTHEGSYKYSFKTVPISWMSLSGTTGGIAGKLDFIPTVALNAGMTLPVSDGANVSFYTLVSGTDAESDPTVIRPDDYNGATNAKVWKRVTATP